MKNNKSFILKCFVSLLLIGVMISCDSNDEILSHQNAKTTLSVEQGRIPFNSTPINNPQVKLKVLDWMQNHNMTNKPISTKQGIIPSFDLNKLYLLYKDGSNNSVIIAYQKGSIPNSKTNFALAFFQNQNDKIVNALIIKTKDLDINNKQISYFDNQGNLGLEIGLNNSLQESTIIYHNNSLSNNTNSEGCSGQETIDCIQDVYTNHGWWSVAYWVGTAFDPDLAAVVAIACAIDCHNGWPDDNNGNDGPGGAGGSW